MDTHLPLLLATHAPSHRRQVARDLLVVAAMTVGMFLFSVLFELREWLTDVTHPLEPYQIDELPLTFAALALSLAWFAWRRWQQSEQELGLRVAAQHALVEREKELAETLSENRLLSRSTLWCRRGSGATLRAGCTTSWGSASMPSSWMQSRFASWRRVRNPRSREALGRSSRSRTMCTTSFAA